MDKILNKIKGNLSKTSIDIMYYGSGLSLGLLLIGIFAYKANFFLWGESYTNFFLSAEIITSAQRLFVQSFFFALLFDCVKMSRK